jgi:dephospho-CoA kinase
VPRPVAVAITGGIGAGKSEALRAFARHGAATVSSDEIVHRLLREDEEIRAALRERWGERVFRDDGDVMREAVGHIVFEDRAELEWLESVLHPRVAREYMAWRAALAQLPEPPAVAVTEVPLLYEVGGDERFDAVVAITAPPELRAERSPGVATEERERRLLADEEKVRRADYAFVNDGSLAALDAFVASVLAELEARA